MLSGDTILALSSAPPPAPRVILRLSGPASHPTALHLTRSPSLPTTGIHRTPIFLPAFNTTPIPATLYLSRAPHSYTTEDSLELHLPGSPWLLSSLLAHLTSPPHNLRLAEPGEFTARAFLAGKLDLTAAEGVAATIAATDSRQLRAARQLMAGALATTVHALAERTAQLLALVEAGIDFSDQDVSFISPETLTAGITALRADITSLLASSSRVNLQSTASDGKPRVVLLGRPNAGKSTLLNALLRRHRAVTSPQSGTTRDVIYEDLKLPHGTIRLTDIAGVGHPELSTGHVTPEIEKEMTARALHAAAEADVLICVREAADPEGYTLPDRPPDLTVITKCDAPQPPPPATTFAGENPHTVDPAIAINPTPAPESGGADHLRVSALTGENLDQLRLRLDHLCFAHESGHAIALNTRHVAQLTAALTSLEGTLENIPQGEEFSASGLRMTLDDLGAITGAISPDDVLGRVFSTFCIGK